MTEEEKNHKKKAFKVLTTDITIEQRKRNIATLLDESLVILSKEIEKLKRRIKLGDLSDSELESVYQELKAAAPKKEE
jgi:predicted nucleotidyltransferase